ncbi:intradiol ring-cleavage dioxygenase [Leptobacterium flavescens]|uniref:Intradiol ring-cleavage dioxygenase n=1 Tax=Leptobacterium flavescens TaxID=472055 RepID=A0A6P0UJX2_9FLAO|nr:intradiol ring-cleavage dioxygenase [Leptobacterium flavescens]NER13605.1 intradiol ring-cleavage dioxygenase [Leptobacterium flavescens]
MRHLLFLISSLLIICSCNSQSSGKAKVGGPCEGCEAVHEYGDMKLASVDTLPGYHTNTPKMKISGTVFKKDGKTPAENVILYIYHTNRKGIYETRGDEKGWARRHGYIQGWVKTGPDGKYTFYTFRPAAYPNGREAEHVHIVVKEPGKNEYYLDSYVFDDDPLLSKDRRKRLKERGGSGLIWLKQQGNLLIADRDLILGKNIPNYK